MVVGEQVRENRFRSAVLLAVAVLLQLAATPLAGAQSFGISNLDFAGLGSVSSSTSLVFGPDGRLYVIQLNGTIDILTIERQGPGNYVVTAVEELLSVKSIPNHNDDGSPDAGNSREAIGIAVVGSATNPIIYATSSDARIGGPSGDKNLDTNSGVVTRLSWIGTGIDDPDGSWDVVDLVRGLPRSEENHATNGLEAVTIGGQDYLIIAQGGHSNAGSPSTNFAWTTEYALSAAVLAVNLTQLEALPIMNDGQRDYVYDLPTVDDPTRGNVNGIDDPDAPGYDGIDINDPFGGNDGLNQAKIVPGGPVQIFSPGYRNAYDLVVTASGFVYVTDNGANGGWGGLPEGEGVDGNVTNNYRPGEPGSSSDDPVSGDPKVNNEDHLHLITNDIASYEFGSFYGGHPTPIRANPAGAGLFARGSHSSDPGDSNGNTYTDDWFRTIPYEPNGTGDAADPQRALPADWPPVPVALANPVEGDFRNPGGNNPDGPDDEIITTWSNNTNGIDEYTASNFGGAMQGDLLAGKSGGSLHRVQVDPTDGSLVALTQNFLSNLGGNPLGITANGDADPFPGTIWVGTFNSNIVVLEPQDFVICIAPGDAGYDPGGDNDSDGYTNQDEEDNGSDLCNGGSQPGDFDKQAGAPLVSNLNDPDDDADGIADADDPLQLGDPTFAGSDAFALPVVNELFSDNPALEGYLGLGLTGLMNNGAPNPNWLDWLDETDAGPNPNDILGGAVGAMTMQMTAGTAVGGFNDQEKAFQYGVQVDLGTGGFRVEASLLNFNDPLQLYGSGGQGELGIFMGDGSQSNFVQITVDANGINVVQEIDDVPTTELGASIAVDERPTGSLALRLDVDSATGNVEAFYSIDGGAFASIGSFAVEGSVLDAIQEAGTVLTVGLIGTSNTPGTELEGTWDYLNVIGRQPAASPIPDVETPLGGGASQDLDLNAYFSDDDGVGNLTYTIVSQTDPAIGATIAGSVLTLSFPATVATSTVTVRGTDATGLFAEQSFTVSVTDAAAIYRVNAGGAEIAAIDGGIPWGADTTASNSEYLTVAGTNNTETFSMIGYAAGVDLATTPTTLFNNERWDGASGPPRITYGFPVGPGSYEVRLYMANGWSGSASPGQRVFSVEVEGVAFPDLTDLDLAATFGHQIGGVITHVVDVTDGTLDIEFFHGAANNPVLNGIEIVGGAGSPPADIPISVASISNQQNADGEIVFLPVIASGGDTPDVFSYSATGLPPDLEIEPTTGLIFGTIASAASSGSPYATSVTVDDADADDTDSVTQNFQWSVTDGSQVAWIDLDEDESYTGRHECSFVQAGDKFYLFGGRENPQTLDTYDFAQDLWSTSASAPKPFNHFQATEYQGLVWVVGAFETNDFPNEDPADFIWVFDPANDLWIQGPSIPEPRRRGGSGLVVYQDKFYMLGGNTLGHSGGYVPWFDEFDPATGTFAALADAPSARDHFHAVVYGDKLYAIGGRLTGGPGGTFAPLIPEVDVYDFATASWSTLPMASDLPTPRAASATAVFDDRIFVMGGEGNGQAYTTVEALDPVTESWDTAPSMNYPRHGTQALVSGPGIYVVAGSPNQGGGNQKNMEAYGADQASGEAGTPGQLTLTASGTGSGGVPLSVSINHTGGNQGVYVSSLAITGPGAADFEIVTPPGQFLLGVGATANVEVSVQSSASATLEVRSNDLLIASLPLGGGTPTCSDSASCDDGIYCNGAELCVGGACIGGAPVLCDDSVSCTSDSCNETTNSCEHIANDAVCDNGVFCDGAEVCDEVSGCQAGPAACLPDEDCDEGAQLCVDQGGGTGGAGGAGGAGGSIGGGTGGTGGAGGDPGSGGAGGGPGASTVRYRSNAGGPTLTASDGGPNWLSNGGLATAVNAYSTTTPSSWSGVEPPAVLFQSESWDPAGGDEMRWEFAVPAGDYEVRLYLAEIYSGAFNQGSRVFDVVVEGTLVDDNYDIFADVGADTGALRTYAATVTDGVLEIEFLHVVENPKVAGIEIVDLTIAVEDADGDGFSVSDGDCNDDDPNVNPGVADTCNGIDDDCDSEVDEDHTPVPTQCGNFGVCQASGSIICDALAGVEIDTCVPGTPAVDDSSCDGLDSDCDGEVDEDCVITPDIKAEVGVVVADDTSWATVNLSSDYGDGMVVVATPVYTAGVPPQIVRVRNASGSSFEVQIAIAAPSGSTAGTDVHYLVIEEGVYDEATYGVRLEAVKYESTITDENNAWSGQQRSYGQTYSSPVVVGQVMTANDPDESVFWARGSSRGNPPNSSNLFTGKTVNEDPDAVRADETIGYVVFEAGAGSVAGQNFQALLGADTVRGVTNQPPYQYALTGLSGASVAVSSLSGMDGNNGGWAVLYGPLDPSGAFIDLAVDEDTLGDSERSHTTEQLSVIVFE